MDVITLIRCGSNIFIHKSSNKSDNKKVCLQRDRASLSHCQEELVPPFIQSPNREALKPARKWSNFVCDDTRGRLKGRLLEKNTSRHNKINYVDFFMLKQKIRISVLVFKSGSLIINCKKIEFAK